MNTRPDLPPTPGAFALELAQRFAPAPDPANPFFKPASVAVRRLLVQAIVEVFGEKDPFAQFASAYERAYVLSFPVGYSEYRADDLDAAINDMRAAWEVIEQDFFLIVDEMRG